MTILGIEKDLDAATLVVTAEYHADAERVWELWADPRMLERWWGPPTWPATVVDHDLSPGGRVSYYMTGPDGEHAGGWWRVLAVDPPKRLEFEDGFADDEGEANEDLPVSRSVVEIAPAPGGGTRMTITSSYDSPAALEQVLSMGMEEGLTAALGQTDALLADAAAGR